MFNVPGELYSADEQLVNILFDLIVHLVRNSTNGGNRTINSITAFIVVLITIVLECFTQII